MKRFVQIHALTMYPPSNLNRDDLGRPKTAIVGGAERTRVSSQSLKRAWRTSDVFKSALKGYLGKRTKQLGVELYKALIDGGMESAKAKEVSIVVAKEVGKTKPAKKPKKDEKPNPKDELIELENETLAHLGPNELKRIKTLASEILAAQTEEDAEVSHQVMEKVHGAADIAMFGRMLAKVPEFNVEAAVQVSHAFTTHRTALEDDYFTAVDDINTRQDSGAGHVGELEFSSGVFYLYVCVDRAQLLKNLGGNEEVYAAALGALVDAIATVSPTGKQNSFASRANAEYVHAEVGDESPRTLGSAFTKPIKTDFVEQSIAALELKQRNFAKCYGSYRHEDGCTLNVLTGEGSIAELKAFVVQP